MEKYRTVESIERAEYYFVDKGRDTGLVVMCYKPSFAKEMAAATGWKMRKVDDVIREHGWKSRVPRKRPTHGASSIPKDRSWWFWSEIDKNTTDNIGERRFRRNYGRNDQM